MRGWKFIHFMRRDVLPVSPFHGVPGNANSFEKALVRELPNPGPDDIRLHIEKAMFIVTENNQKRMILKRSDRYGFYPYQADSLHYCSGGILKNCSPSDGSFQFADNSSS